ncbi:hypothetical protein PROFUN_02421 [Planoprotostelium fungivorum]|uniref:Uncharacterized protein n=1 Tax=Planoprotostelium fungivorum TaxID=1890364 RepID=A0A2P6NUT1_9EUKA|nr:hypothetical protein PROFUN_02421 [Planoprotostelium fungivorum]
MSATDRELHRLSLVGDDEVHEHELVHDPQVLEPEDELEEDVGQPSDSFNPPQLTLKEVVKHSAEQLEGYLVRRGKGHLSRKKIGDMDDVELFELMSLCKSVRERIKYSVKTVRGKTLDGRISLSKDIINRYKLDNFKSWVRSLPTDQISSSIHEWTSRQRKELILKAYKCCNLHRLPRKWREDYEMNPMDIIEGRSAIIPQPLDATHVSTNPLVFKNTPINTYQNNVVNTIEPPVPAPYQVNTGLISSDANLMTELTFIKNTLIGLSGRIERLERRLDDGLPISTDAVSIPKNAIRDFLQQIGQ